ncbi:MAG: tetratricopeptide repeat protein [Deltaproteobacteria bacterium]|nr:tetratricopeptide repeat protein [Deltaproteobacteria bacterium]MBW2119296.1 tetratricopeptide repeat protein [Deltaproteobacteria bacterium]
MGTKPETRNSKLETRNPQPETHKKSATVRYLRPSHVLVLFFLMGFFPACAWRTSEIARVEPPAIPAQEEISPQERAIRQAYKNYTLASIAISRGSYKKAREYLSLAVEKDPESFYLSRKMALLLKKLKDYRTALGYALKCLEIDTEDFNSRTLLADLYSLMGNDDLAIEQYDKALDLDPENQRIRLLIVTILLKKGQFKKALLYLDRLIEQNPDLVIAHYYKGRIYLELNRHNKAEDAFLEALRLNKRLEPALFDLATLYQMMERSVDAIETYEKLLGFYPHNAEARERLLSLYFKVGMEKKAEQQIQKIKELSKPGEPIRKALGLLYLKQGRLNESIEELNLTVSAFPDDHKSRYYLASAYEENGGNDNALKHFRMIKLKSKYYINAQLHIAFILETRKQYDESIAVLEKALALKKGQTELYLMLGSLYETKKEYDKGIEVVKKGLEQDGKNIDLIFRLGVILDKNGKKESCIEQMKRILDINPDHADALNYIGYTFADQGIKLDEAMDLIQKALKIKPESGYIIDSLGWVYFQKGLYDKALHYLEKASKLTPDPTIHEHLGDVYLKKEKPKKALDNYQKALSKNHPEQEKIKEKIIEIKQLLKQKD